MSKYKADDIDLLLPSFAAKVRQVMEKMEKLGYEPIPFDTLRTPAEAAKFFARGVGSKDSMHCYGVACDIICGSCGWSCFKNKCNFYIDLQHTVEALGLTSGARFKRKDYPHFQMCKVADQAAVRSIKDPVAREAYCLARLRKTV